MQSDQASPPAASPEFLDRSDPEPEIARSVVGSPVNPIAAK
jgi:hypothetical protein